MTPRIARAEPQHDASGTLRRGTVLLAEIDRVVARQRDLDAKSIVLARRMGEVQRRRDELVASAAGEEAVTAARHNFADLRDQTDENSGARAILAARHRALLRDWKPVAAAEALEDALVAIRRVDGEVRQLARNLRSLVPVMEKTVAEQARTEQRGEDGNLHALANDAPHVAELLRVARTVTYYATECPAPAVERNTPATSDRAGADPSTSEALAER